MSAVHFSYLDLLVVVIVLVSAAYATWRGFVSETLSIFAWAAAAFAALYFAPAVAPFLQELISPKWIGTAAAYVAVFLVVLIPLSFISYRFAESVHHSPVGALDRSLGFAFGVVRGFAIVGVAYIIFSSFVPVPKQPEWVTSAGTLPIIQNSAEVLLSLVPDQNIQVAKASDTPAQNTVPQPRPAPRDAANMHKGKARQKTYGAADRRALDNLIEATGSGGDSKP
jgi:membrane protein required for colicin V production